MRSEHVIELLNKMSEQIRMLQLEMISYQCRKIRNKK